MLAIYRPIDFGDTIKIGDKEGVVEDITHNYVTLFREGHVLPYVYVETTKFMTEKIYKGKRPKKPSTKPVVTIAEGTGVPVVSPQ